MREITFYSAPTLRAKPFRLQLQTQEESGKGYFSQAELQEQTP